VAETATALDRLLPAPPGDGPPWAGEAGRDALRAALLTAFLRRLDERYGELVRTRSGEVVTRAWRARSATLGRRVRVDLGAEDVVGTAVDVTPEGHLVVEADDGRRRTLAVGDVVHLRGI
jgi:BirA family biotin operon repressor/biotin-[acetyl-CoA-carboxylase] ligase